MQLFLYDLPNFIAIILVVFVSYRIKAIPSWLALILGVSAILPFLINNVLFPAKYMPDQFKYFDMVQCIRSLDSNCHAYSKTVGNASWFLSFVPLPFVETIKSLGFYNRFIVTSLIIWLYSKKDLRGMSLFVLIFYPSFLLYSSLSLRDPLITCFMLISVIFLIDGKTVKSILFGVPLFFLKFQNFFLIVLFVFFYLLRKKSSIIYRFRYFLYAFSILIFIPFMQELIHLLDFYRKAMFVENGGDISQYTQIGDVYGFFLLGLQSAPFFLMKPLPWEANSMLQFIQSLENVVLFLFLVVFFYKSYKFDKYMTVTWFFYLLISMTIYGLVVFNYGTAVRYKFPFIICVVVGLSYDLYKTYGISLKWRIR
ncbi:hypothetical protein V6259_18445 [Marinomonas sp. TI.3.20]|uniref:hypothetical protein n=1 Tax=Marinomonas sp. TI.3.20 TaxID=3121296 RepID=UPI0031204CF6